MVRNAIAGMLLIVALTAPSLSGANPNNSMRSGQTLVPGQQLVSENGLYMLTFERRSGNVLVHPQHIGPAPIHVYWETRTWNRNAARFTFDETGRPAVYDAGGKAIWTLESQAGGDVLTLENNGELVLTGDGRRVWSSNVTEPKRSRQDRCDTERWQWLIGKPEADAREIPVVNKRVIEPGQPVTTDLDPYRLNILLGKDGVVRQLGCN